MVFLELFRVGIEQGKEEITLVLTTHLNTSVNASHLKMGFL